MTEGIFDNITDLSTDEFFEKLRSTQQSIITWREESGVSRKKLGDLMRCHRESSPQDKVKNLGSMIRSFQEEVESLTRRAKSAEDAFFSLSSALLSTPFSFTSNTNMKSDDSKWDDPFSDQKVSELKAEKEDLQEEVDHLRSEIEELRQDADQREVEAQRRYLVAEEELRKVDEEKKELQRSLRQVRGVMDQMRSDKDKEREKDKEKEHEIEELSNKLLSAEMDMNVLREELKYARDVLEEKTVATDESDRKLKILQAELDFLKKEKETHEQKPNQILVPEHDHREQLIQQILSLQEQLEKLKNDKESFSQINKETINLPELNEVGDAKEILQETPEKKDEEENSFENGWEDNTPNLDLEDNKDDPNQHKDLERNQDSEEGVTEPDLHDLNSHADHVKGIIEGNSSNPQNLIGEEVASTQLTPLDEQVKEDLRNAQEREQKLISEKLSLVSQLQQQQFSSAESIKSIEEERNHLLSTLKSLESEISQLKTEKEELNKERVKIQQQKSLLEEELKKKAEDAQLEISLLQEKITSLELRLADSLSERDAHERVISSFNREREEIEKLIQVQEEKQTIFQNLQLNDKLVESLRAEIENLKNQVSLNLKESEEELLKEDTIEIKESHEIHTEPPHHNENRISESESEPERDVDHVPSPKAKSSIQPEFDSGESHEQPSMENDWGEVDPPIVAVFDNNDQNQQSPHVSIDATPSEQTEQYQLDNPSQEEPPITNSQHQQDEEPGEIPPETDLLEVGEEKNPSEQKIDQEEKEPSTDLSSQESSTSHFEAILQETLLLELSSSPQSPSIPQKSHLLSQQLEPTVNAEEILQVMSVECPYPYLPVLTHESDFVASSPVLLQRHSHIPHPLSHNHLDSEGEQLPISLSLSPMTPQVRILNIPRTSLPEEELQELTERRDSLLNELSSLKDNKDSLDAQIIDLSSRREQLIREISLLEANLQRLQNPTDVEIPSSSQQDEKKLRGELIRVEKELQDALRDKRKLVLEWSGKLSAFEEEILLLETQNRELRDEIELLQSSSTIGSAGGNDSIGDGSGDDDNAKLKSMFEKHSTKLQRIRQILDE